MRGAHEPDATTRVRARRASRAAPRPDTVGARPVEAEVLASRVMLRPLWSLCASWFKFCGYSIALPRVSGIQIHATAARTKAAAAVANAVGKPRESASVPTVHGAAALAILPRL